MTISTDTILYEARNNIAYITLNRPESLNAISRELGRGLREALDLFKDDPDLYVAILIGSGGRAFSAGMDLKERASLDAAGDRPESPIRRPLVSSYADRGVFKPVIAAIDGYCVAGGLEMSLSCDIRVATRQSQFGLPEARWSIFPGHAVHNLSRMIPLGEALNMMLTGTRIDSQRAYDIGSDPASRRGQGRAPPESATKSPRRSSCAPRSPCRESSGSYMAARTCQWSILCGWARRSWSTFKAPRTQSKGRKRSRRSDGLCGSRGSLNQD